MEAEHVQQRHLRDDRAEQFRVTGDHRAHEQSAVTAPRGAQHRRSGDAPGDEVGGDGREVLEGPCPVGAERGPVPARSVLTAAPDVRDHVGSAPLQPRAARHRAVVGGERDLEAAVSVEQGGAGACTRAVRADHEVRHAGAVPGDREELLHGQARRVEAGRSLLEDLRTAPDRPVVERGRLQEAGDVEEEFVGDVRVRVHHGDGGELGNVRERLARPSGAGAGGEDLDTGADIVHRRQDQVVTGPRVPGQSRPPVGGEQHLRGPVARQEGVEAEGQQ